MITALSATRLTSPAATVILYATYHDQAHISYMRLHENTMNPGCLLAGRAWGPRIVPSGALSRSGVPHPNSLHRLYDTLHMTIQNRKREGFCALHLSLFFISTPEHLAKQGSRTLVQVPAGGARAQVVKSRRLLTDREM